MPNIEGAIRNAKPHRAAWYLKWIRTNKCLACQTPLEIHAHHIQVGNPNGVSTKVSDFRAVPLCSTHHGDLHALGEKEFWELKRFNPTSLIAVMMSVYAREHPDGNVREAMLQSMEDVLIESRGK